MTWWVAVIGAVACAGALAAAFWPVSSGLSDDDRDTAGDEE